MINLDETNRIKNAVDATPEAFKETIETTDLGICITDEDGNYVAVNDNYTQITGYSREELVGKNFLMVVPDEHQEDLKEKHEEFIEVQIEIFDKFQIKGKDGKLISIDVDAGFTDKINDKPHKLTFIQAVGAGDKVNTGAVGSAAV